MSEPVADQAYADLKAWLSTHGEEIVGVAKDEASALYGEILTWGIVGGLLEAATGLVLLAVAFGLALLCRKLICVALKSANELIGGPAIGGSLITGLASAFILVMGVASVASGLYSVAFALAAPRLYVLHQIGNLL